MFLLIFGIPQSCFDATMIWCQVKVRLWIHKGSIGNNLENMSYNFSTEKMRVWPTGSATIHRHVKKDVFPKFVNKFVLGEDKNVVDDNTNHRRERMVFLITNSIDILEELKIFMMITTYLSRGLMKM